MSSNSKKIFTMAGYNTQDLLKILIKNRLALASRFFSEILFYSSLDKSINQLVEFNFEI